MAYRWDEEAQITIDENFRSEVCARMLTFKDGGDKMEDKKKRMGYVNRYFSYTNI